MRGRLPEPLPAGGGREVRILPAGVGGIDVRSGRNDRIDAIEKRLILATVQHTRTREAAAAVLGISVKTLYNRLRAYESATHASIPQISESPVVQQDERSMTN